MFTLLGELNLWTFDDNISMKDTDFGAFRYHDKRFDSSYEEGKRSYCQKRGMVYVPTNKKGNKLKDSIKYLEEQLRDYSAVYCRWYENHIVQMLLSNGLLVYIEMNVATGDAIKIAFDKYLIGKVLDHISDACITKSHLICTYMDNQITVIYFTKLKRYPFDKINKLEPKLCTSDFFGCNGRRLDKKIRVNKSGDLILIWWKSTMNEVYPWSPTMKEHDRANIHLYRLTGIKLDLICYVRTEFDPLCITFDVHNENIIHSVEQKVSRKGEVTIEWRTYEISQQDKLQRIAVISVPLPTHTSCMKFSPNQDLLLLCCIDGSVILYDEMKGTTSSIKATFIPTLSSWHSDGMIFSIGNDRGQFQHFDIALHYVRSQTLNDETLPVNIFDLSSYFRNQPALLRIEWNKKTDPSSYIGYYNHGDALFLLLFERGPIGTIRFIEADDLTGDTLVRRYLSISQVEQAIALLLSLNWDTHPSACMHSLNQVLNYLFKLPLTTERENLIQNALGSFHVPVRPISAAIEEEYGDEVRDLTRRFFHHLLRYQMFEKAFRLAIDLNDHDLFMDIHFYALILNAMEVANAAKEKAEQILSRSNSCSSSHSTCSRESCSLCSGSSSEKGEESYSEESEDSRKEDDNNHKETHKQQKRHSYRKNTRSQTPPLPVLYPSSRYNDQILLPDTTLNDPSTNKSDYDVTSTSFNTPNICVENVISNRSSLVSVSNTYFASTSFGTPSYTAHTKFGDLSSVVSANSSNRIQVYNELSEDLMSTSFGNMSFNRTATNDCQSGMTTVPEETTFISTPFNNRTYELTSDVSSSSLLPSFDSIDSNIMTTSFSSVVPTSTNLAQNTKYESTSSTSDAQCNSAANKLSSMIHKTNSARKYEDANNEEALSIDNNFPINKPLKTVRKQTNLMDVLPLSSTISTSFTNYLPNLPKKNIPLSRSSSALVDVNEQENGQKFFTTLQTLQRQNSASNVLQSSPITRANFHSSKTYRTNSDLNYIPYHGSCDNIVDVQRYNVSSKRISYRSQSVHNMQNRNAKVGSQGSVTTNKENKALSNVPPLPVVNTSNTKVHSPCPTLTEAPTINEKPKVKFSDTVTHILVPGTSQPHRQKRVIATQLQVTDPQRELAESLPLCLGNEDYLKDFQPLSKDTVNETTKEASKPDESSKIKVVHFGLL